MKARSLSPPLVWIRPSVGGPEDVEAGLLVGYVEKELANEGTEYCEASLEEFKTQIHDKLAAARPPVVPTAPGEVAVVAEDGDLTATQRLNAFLVESLKLEPRRLHFSGEAPRDPAAFARAVERCSHAVVFWGATSEEWVSNVLSLEPIAAKANAQRVCVYGASPATAEKETFRSGRAPLVLEPSTGVNEGDLRRFLALGRHTP
jgi:hypothetical protein